MDRNSSVRLAERAIRRAQIAQAVLSEQFEARGARGEHSAPAAEPLRLPAVHAGLVAGLLGALVSLLFNIGGAALFGIETFRLLRVYSTIVGGPSALDSTSGGLLVLVLVMHLQAGAVFGAIFALFAKKFCCPRLWSHVQAGFGYGIGIWVLNYYGVLSWLQPLLWGEATIVETVPAWVAFLTHGSYGITVALLIYPLEQAFAPGSAGPARILKPDGDHEHRTGAISMNDSISNNHRV